MNKKFMENKNKMLIINEVHPVITTNPNIFIRRAMVVPIAHIKIVSNENSIIKYIGVVENEIMFSSAKIVSLE
jgi:hypothetical protein